MHLDKVTPIKPEKTDVNPDVQFCYLDEKAPNQPWDPDGVSSFGPATRDTRSPCLVCLGRVGLTEECLGDAWGAGVQADLVFLGEDCSEFDSCGG